MSINPLDSSSSSDTDVYSYPATPVKTSREGEVEEVTVRSDGVAALAFNRAENSPEELPTGVDREYPSPDRYYEVKRGDDGRFSVLFTPTAKTYGRGVKVIYKIKKVQSDDDAKEDAEAKPNPSKVGMTEQGFIKRMRQHLSCANHPERDRGKGPLYDDMRTEGSQFVMGVVTTLETDYDADIESETKDDLGSLEVDVIADHQSVEHGYNQNRGGGGGTIAAEDGAEKVPEFKPDSFRTPSKPGYPIRRRRRKVGGKKPSRLFVDVTPNGKKKDMKFVVYGFRRDDGKWLIGETEQRFMDRMYGYHYDFNHPEKDSGQRPLPVDVRENPSRWRVYILYQGPAVKRVEALWIEAKNSIEDGFNQLGGGGGPSSSQHFAKIAEMGN